MAETAAARPAWSSRRSFILAAIGSAVGLGSIWKFPYMVGENGGGAFVAVYLLGLLVLVLPLMIAEFVIGRRGRGSVIVSFARNAEEAGASRTWGAAGMLAVAAGFLILSFYTVIGGWTLAYIPRLVTGALANGDAAAIAGLFDEFLQNPGEMMLWHAAFMTATIAIVALGVATGLERAVMLLMPLMFVLMAGLVVYGLIAGDGLRAFHFMADADFTKLDADVVIDAIGLGFFSIGVGIGSMITYAAYAGRDIDLTSATIVTIVADTAVSFMAGFAIFPIVFAYGLDPAQGPGLMFVTLPVAFAQMDAGIVVGAAFFVLLFVSALASAISLLELVVAAAVDAGVSRLIAALSGGALCYVLGMLTVWSFNDWSGFYPLAGVGGFETKTVYDLIDYLTSNVMLPIGGILVAVMAGYVMRPAAVFDELDWRGGAFAKLWRFTIRFICPVAIAVLLAVNLAP